MYIYYVSLTALGNDNRHFRAPLTWNWKSFHCQQIFRFHTIGENCRDHLMENDWNVSQKLTSCTPVIRFRPRTLFCTKKLPLELYRRFFCVRMNIGCFSWLLSPNRLIEKRSLPSESSFKFTPSVVKYFPVATLMIFAQIRLMPHPHQIFRYSGNCNMVIAMKGASLHLGVAKTKEFTPTIFTVHIKI